MSSFFQWFDGFTWGEVSLPLKWYKYQQSTNPNRDTHYITHIIKKKSIYIRISILIFHYS